MPSSLTLAPEAEDDLAEAYAWYEQLRPGLGEEFLRCVDASLQSICRFPESHATVHEDYRRALVRRFPFAIFYRSSNATIIVYSVFHTSRDPNKWQARLS